jgi:MOSC domain-containing protein YiiM
MQHRSTPQLDALLDHIRLSPADNGTLEMIVRRPADQAREVLETGELSRELGLVGDNWSTRGESPPPETQLNVMNARAVDAVAGTRDRWALAGDQLYLDLDLSASNLPPGTRLGIGGAVIEVTPIAHTGCAKFTQRFGLDAHRWVNSPVGKDLHLRGINAMVITPGVISRGDTVTKL